MCFSWNNLTCKFISLRPWASRVTYLNSFLFYVNQCHNCGTYFEYDLSGDGSVSKFKWDGSEVRFLVEKGWRLPEQGPIGISVRNAKAFSLRTNKTIRSTLIGKSSRSGSTFVWNCMCFDGEMHSGRCICRFLYNSNVYCARWGKKRDRTLDRTLWGLRISWVHFR